MVSHIKQLEFLLTTRVFWDRHFPLIHGIFKQCLLKVFFKLDYKLVCFHMTSHIFSLAKSLFIPPFLHTNSDPYLPTTIFPSLFSVPDVFHYPQTLNASYFLPVSL